MSRWILSLLLVVAMVSGCPSQTAQQVECKLDPANVSGQWLSLKAGPGGDSMDPSGRVEFRTVDGKKQARYSAGPAAPGSPATNKATYEFSRVNDKKEAIYVLNLIQGKTPERIERLKKDNRKKEMKFEARLIVGVETKRCLLTINDVAVSYVKGKEEEEANPAGQRSFAPWDTTKPDKQPFSMEHCTDVGALVAFDKPQIDLEKDKALDHREGVYAKEPVYFNYLPHGEPEDKDALAKWVKEKGLVSEPGCTYDFEGWMRDHLVTDKTEVKPLPDGYVDWVWMTSFEQSNATGDFLEMHRYKTCDGKRTLISNACTIVWPNRSRAEYEEAAKGAGAAGPTGEATPASERDKAPAPAGGGN
jgi:hypothetical protein